MTNPPSHKELAHVIDLYTRAVEKLLHYECALFTIANQSRDRAEDAHAIARRALERFDADTRQ